MNFLDSVFYVEVILIPTVHVFFCRIRSRFTWNNCEVLRIIYLSSLFIHISLSYVFWVFKVPLLFLFLFYSKRKVKGEGMELSEDALFPCSQ